MRAGDARLPENLFQAVYGDLCRHRPRWFYAGSSNFYEFPFEILLIFSEKENRLKPSGKESTHTSSLLTQFGRHKKI